MAIGVAGSLVCFAAVLAVKHRWRVDDSLDVSAVHGVGGMLGSVLLAVFGAAAPGGTGAANANGELPQMGVQAGAVAVVALWSAVLAFVLAKGAALVVPMRVTAEQEHDGPDISHRGERAYGFD